jgi:hypothetical protein
MPARDAGGDRSEDMDHGPGTPFPQAVEMILPGASRAPDGAGACPGVPEVTKNPLISLC